MVNKLLENKYTNYINTDIHYLSTDGDWIHENGYLDKFLFYKANLHPIEKGYLKIALSVKRKITDIQEKFTNTNNTEKKKKPIFNTNDFLHLPS